MKTIKPTQQFRNCFFKVLLATQETDFDDDAITDAMWQWTNSVDGFNLLGFGNTKSDEYTGLWNEFYDYLQAFNHMGMKTIEDAQKAHDKYWNDLEEEDIELGREDALHSKGEHQTDLERE